MYHFKYEIEKKTILVKLDELKTEVLEITEKLPDQIIIAQTEIKSIDQANELMNILINENLSEYQKQTEKEWIEIHDALENNNSRKEVLNKLMKQYDSTFNISKDLVNKKKSIIEYGKQLYNLLDKMDSALLVSESKKDYRPFLQTNVHIEESANRGDIIIKCIAKTNMQPFGFKSEITQFEYFNNKNELCFNDKIIIKVDNEFLKKIEFICNYLDINNLEKYYWKDDWFFPISINANVFDLGTTDKGFESNIFEFKLLILNHEIHKEYSENILNCPFRLRLLIDFILSYKN